MTGVPPTRATTPQPVPDLALLDQLPEPGQMVELPRALWGAVVHALTHDDENVREQAAAALEAVAPSAWWDDLGKPGLMARRLAGIGVSKTHARSGWERTRPRIPPDDKPTPRPYAPDRRSPRAQPSRQGARS